MSENNKNVRKKDEIQKSLKPKAAKLSPFWQRPLPEPEEVSRFENAVREEERKEEMDDNLSAIYHDNKGNLVDVKKVKKRRRLGIIVMFKRLFVLTILAAAIYGLYSYYIQKPVGNSGIELNIKAPKEIVAGNSFSYEIDYHNGSGMTLSDVKLEILFPEGFVSTDSSQAPSGVNSWTIGSLADGEGGQISISGYLVAPENSANVITARFSYIPANFSSEFRKEASANSVVSGFGFNIISDYINTALVGQKNEMSLNLGPFQDNHLSEIYLQASSSDNIKIDDLGPIDSATASSSASSSPLDNVKIEKVGERTWRLSNLPVSSDKRLRLPLDFNVLEKKADQEDLSINLFSKGKDDQDLPVWNKTFRFDILKSDLNISLSVDDNKSDFPVDFGSTLKYKLSYSNNGDASLNDLVLMAVIKGDTVDWNSLKDPSGGAVSGNAIVWSKEELPALAELAPGDSGEIDFSLQLNPFSPSQMSSNQNVTSYAQYSLDNKPDLNSEDNKSNTVVNPLNSDFSLNEKILYFNENNIPVGAGPLPPQVGQTTKFRVLWTVKNNMHDLNQVKVTSVLPPGVNWADSGDTNVGSISYNSSNRTVTWNIGLLPLSVYRADAEFSISLTPASGDRGKIMVLSSGAVASAQDSVTKAQLRRQSSPKTTRLEDDSIAALSNNGQVQ